VIDAVLVADPDVANMITAPSEIAVTRPFDKTVATAVFAELHVTVAPGMVLPPASFTVGTNVTVSPIEVRVFDVGVRVTEFAT
tara:strand:+ start:160 stop:408 length:249 start_codon:yes stop_codon:yes gene_type:complete